MPTHAQPILLRESCLSPVSFFSRREATNLLDTQIWFQGCFLSVVRNDVSHFHQAWFPFTANSTTKTQKPKRLCGWPVILPTNRFVLAQIGRCRGRNWLYGNQALSYYFHTMVLKLMVILSCNLGSNLSIVWSTAKLVHRDGELKTTERIVYNR